MHSNNAAFQRMAQPKERVCFLMGRSRSTENGSPILIALRCAVVHLVWFPVAIQDDKMNAKVSRCMNVAIEAHWILFLEWKPIKPALLATLRIRILDDAFPSAQADRSFILALFEKMVGSMGWALWIGATF